MSRERVIYRIRNKINKKFYIGMSVNYKRRYREHKINPPVKMLKDIKKYGWKNFEFSILWDNLTTGEKEAFKWEIDTIATLQPEYNSTEGGDGGPNLFGEDCPSSKITEYEVIKLRKMWASKIYKGKELAELFKISRAQVSGIVTGKYWQKAEGIISCANKSPNKGTHNNIGSNNGRAKLIELDILNIRSNFNNNIEKLSIEYNVSQSTIKDIVYGRTWTHIGGKIVKPKRVRLNKQKAEEIRELFNTNKHTRRELSDLFEISNEAIRNILTGRTWKNAIGKLMTIKEIHDKEK